MSDREFRLITLGRLALVAISGDDAELGKRRRKLALLAFLALSKRPMSRDLLADLFWGEESEERAKHSLSDALYHIRRVLGREALSARRAEVELTPGAALMVDAAEFAAACAAGDHERAIALYGGPFLHDVYIDRSPRFDGWAAGERDRYAQLFIGASSARCEELSEGQNWGECANVALKWLEADPYSPRAALAFLRAKSAVGTPAAAVTALEQWRSFQQRLGEDEADQIDPAVAEVLGELERSAARMPRGIAPPDASPTAAGRLGDGAPPAARAGTAEPQRESFPPHEIAADGRHRGWRWAALAAGIILLAGAAGYLVRRGSAAEPPARPTVAIVDIQNARGDSTIAWLQEGLRQMISADLSRSDAVDVVAPSRIRDILRGEQRPADAMTTDAATAIARRAGASWVVGGGITRGDGAFVLDISVREVASGRLVRVYTVTGSDILAVADQAAAHIISAANSGASGPHFADVETPSLDAFQHFIRAQQAQLEGRGADVLTELDAAIALDSGFVSALTMRLRLTNPATEPEVLARLSAAYEGAKGRATAWDRLDLALYEAEHNGEHSRAEALGRQLVERYPHDPRAYARLAEVYLNHGRWPAADSVLRGVLALDSLGTRADDGPCVPCTAYNGLISLRLTSGDVAGAEQVARRWTRLQPDLPAAWGGLATALSFEEHYDAAMTATRRAISLSGVDAEYSARLVRVLLMARRLDEAEAMIRGWLKDPAMRADALDLQYTLERERGQYRAASRTFEQMSRAEEAGGLDLVHGNDLAHLGEYAAAERLYDFVVRAAGSSSGDGGPVPATPIRSFAGDAARAFAWHHALLADAIAPVADTARLRALADSIEMIGARSYYGRDWGLHHHVRGLIAMRAGRPADALREFALSRWGRAGWTRTLEEMAQADLEMNRPDSAAAVLREAYAAPLDAMGRYVPRSELDYWMAVAFTRAGARDSAALYDGYVRAAWKDADPEIRRLLGALR